MDIQIKNTSDHQPECILENYTSPNLLLNELRARYVAFALDDARLVKKDIYIVQTLDVQGKPLALYQVSRNSTAFRCMLVHSLQKEDPGAFSYLASGIWDTSSLPDALMFLRKCPLNHALDFALRAMAADPNHKAIIHLINDIVSPTDLEDDASYKFTGDFEHDQIILDQMEKDIENNRHSSDLYLLLAALIHLYGPLRNPVDLNKAYKGLMQYGRILTQKFKNKGHFSYYNAAIVFLTEKLETLFKKNAQDKQLKINQKNWKTSFAIHCLSAQADPSKFYPSQQRIHFINPIDVASYNKIALPFDLAKQLLDEFDGDSEFIGPLIRETADVLKQLFHQFKDNLPQEFKNKVKKILVQLEEIGFQNNNNA